MLKKHIFVLAGLLLISLAAGCAQNAPAISLDVEELDLGEMVNGAIVTREVLVRNTGNAPLVVESVSTTCGCTTATLVPMTIEPGGSGVLTVEFDSGAHGPELNGELTRQIFIASNDPEEPDFVLTLSANVLEP